MLPFSSKGWEEKVTYRIRQRYIFFKFFIFPASLKFYNFFLNLECTKYRWGAGGAQRFPPPHRKFFIFSSLLDAFLGHFFQNFSKMGKINNNFPLLGEKVSLRPYFIIYPCFSPFFHFSPNINNKFLFPPLEVYFCKI